MQIIINIPLKVQIINGGFPVSIAPKGESWSSSQLQDYKDRRGVYIHHCSGKILYIGKTTRGDYGTFGERLRREFQETASGNSELYQLLSSQTDVVKAYCIDESDIDMMIDHGSVPLNPIRKALILEQVLIGIFEPGGNKI